MIFLRKAEVTELQGRLIDDFGGAPGLLNEGALEAALVAVENRRFYEDADLATCAATCAFHLTQAHAFVDGNKRIGAAVMETFLVANGAALDAEDDEIYELIIGIAGSGLDRARAEEWLKPRVRGPA